MECYLCQHRTVVHYWFTDIHWPDEWDVIMCCLFIDTAHNVIKYLYQRESTTETWRPVDQLWSVLASQASSRIDS